MKTRRGILGWLIGGALLLSYCTVNSGASYRFRMTVEAQTPQGPRSGSSVFKAWASRRLALTAEEHAGSGGTIGEAVVVGLPSGPMFVTLKMPLAGDDLSGAVTHALAPEAPRGNIDRYLAAIRKLGGWFTGTRKAELPREQWPLMVRFRDINDPTSVEIVDPDAIGVKRIVLETTGDDVTTGIQNMLPWLKRLKGAYYKGFNIENLTASNVAAHLSPELFSTELSK